MSPSSILACRFESCTRINEKFPNSAAGSGRRPATHLVRIRGFSLRCSLGLASQDIAAWTAFGGFLGGSLTADLRCSSARVRSQQVPLGEVVFATPTFDLRRQVGWTALFWSCLAGHADVARLLAKGKADVNAKDEVSDSIAFCIAPSTKAWVFQLCLFHCEFERQSCSSFALPAAKINSTQVAGK